MEPADDEDLEARRRLADLVSAEAGAITGAAAGMMLAGPAGALVGAGAGTMVQHVIKEVMARQFGRATEAFDVAADQAGLTPRELLERILGDEQLLHLASKVLRAAADTTVDAKIRALGRALGRGILAGDDAAINLEQFLVDTLAPMDALHLRVLQQVSQGYDGYGSARAPDGGQRAYGWSPEALREHQPRLVPVLGSVLGTLSSSDLISNTAVGGYGYVPGEADRWALTETGQRLLDFLEERGCEGPDPSAQDSPED